MRVYRQEIRDVKETASGYGAEGVTLGIFFVSVFTLAMMGNGLAIALGGPILATPFVYMVLQGYSPNEVVDQMTTAPGEGSQFDLGGRRR